MKLNYFNFKLFRDKFLLTNDLGRYAFLSRKAFKDLINKTIEDDELKQCLIENKFIYDETELEFTSNNRYIARDLKNHLNLATSLHIFVVTTACNMNCVYCQANNGAKCSNLFMTKEIAEKSVDIALQSPAKYLNFEFQGGEPLMNFEVIKHITEYAEIKKEKHVIRYNIVSNLTLLEDEMIEFFSKYNFGISTSLDGPEFVHDKNRVFVNQSGTYNLVKNSIKKLKSLGIHVGAIQTTTRNSLMYPKEIVHEYVDMGFDSIFIRPLTPLGKADKYWKEIGYTAQDFIDFYRSALDELIKINQEGRYIREEHSSIFIRRILGQSVNYMELRSPCGAAMGQLAYYADGNIFTCDEGRMLYEMGDSAFRLGDVWSNGYKDIINSGVCKSVCASSILETIPKCCDCVYQPYCGVCPVVSYATTGDIIDKEPNGYRCKIYCGILDYLFSKFYDEDEITIDVLHSWSN